MEVKDSFCQFSEEPVLLESDFQNYRNLLVGIITSQQLNSDPGPSGGNTS